MGVIYARLDALPLWLYAVALVLIYRGATWLHGWATRRALRTNIRANSEVQRWRWTENRWFVDTTTPRGK